jgi:hypothetical protein
MGDLATSPMRTIEVALQILLGSGPSELHDARLLFKRHLEAIVAQIE